MREPRKIQAVFVNGPVRGTSAFLNRAIAGKMEALPLPEKIRFDMRSCCRLNSPLVSVLIHPGNGFRHSYAECRKTNKLSDLIFFLIIEPSQNLPRYNINKGLPAHTKCGYLDKMNGE